MPKAQTVHIESEHFADGVVIDAADFDPNEHKRFGEPKQARAGGGDPSEVKDSDGGTGKGPNTAKSPKRTRKGRK